MQLNKFKSGIKNGTQETLKLSSNVISDTIHDTDFPQKLLLTNTEVSKIHKGFANGSTVNIES